MDRAMIPLEERMHVCKCCSSGFSLRIPTVWTLKSGSGEALISSASARLKVHKILINQSVNAIRTPVLQTRRALLGDVLMENTLAGQLQRC